MLIFSAAFQRKTQLSNFVNIRPVAADLFHKAVGQTEKHYEFKGYLLQFCERAVNSCISILSDS
jgi:hypothetical protein